MALATLRCKNCGAPLKIDSDTAGYICPNCHTTYAVEQTVNQTIQNTNIEHAQTVNVIDDGTAKIHRAIDNAEAQMQIGNYPAAQKLFRELTENYAQEYRTWLGLARAISQNFTKRPVGKSEFEVVRKAIKNAKMMAAGDESVQAQIVESSSVYLTQWEEYSKLLIVQRNQKAEENKLRAEELFSKKRQDIDNVETMIAKKKAKLENTQKLGKKVPVIAVLVAAVLMVLAIIIAGIYLHNDIAEIISSLWAGLLMCGLFVWLPVKLIFIFSIKALRVSTEMMINSSNVKIMQIKGEIRRDQERLNSELQAVLSDTNWLDR